VERLAVDAELRRLLGSKTLADTDRLRRFLEFVVVETLDGRGGQLKEMTVALHVLDRTTDFDPRTDATVRVDARRLRAKLAQYYADEGSHDTVAIDLPKGSYVPTFTARVPAGGEAPVAPPAATPDVVPEQADRTVASRPLVLLLSSAVVLAIAGLVVSIAVRQRASSGETLPMIAVLPFANASADPDNAYFCFGLVEDLTTGLAQTGVFRVVARTSAQQFKGGEDVTEIGRRLRARYLVEGSVRKAGTKLRITAQLIDTGDGHHLWANSYDRDTRDILATEDEIARAIATALRPFVSVSETGRAAVRTRAPDPETHELFLRGQYLVNGPGKQDPARGLTLLEQAIERMPDFAPAHSAISVALMRMALDEPSATSDLVGRARRAALRAIELDPNLAEAHAQLAWITFTYDWNPVDAEHQFRRAIALNPSAAPAYHRYSLLLMAERRFDEAVALSRQAIELDPVAPVARSNRAFILLCAHRYAEAVAQAREAMDLTPPYFRTYTYLGSAYAGQGRMADAIAAYKSAVAAAPDDPDALASLGRAYALAGATADARGVLDDLLRPGRQEPASQYQLAFLYDGLGERNQAFAALASALAHHENDLVFLDVDPLFDEVRADPRFRAVVDRVGVRR
jgi:serine/threonine-protein kinase